MKRILFPILLTLLPNVTLAQGVVSAADPRAAEAGREILRAGGSATDAAMAMMLALTVVEPQSSGIGGGGFLLHHDQKSGKISSIDGRETAPASASPSLFLDASNTPRKFRDVVPGGLSAGIPGNIALMAKAHARWGKLPWPRLFDPAIRLADKGYDVTPRLAGALDFSKPAWVDFPEARALYWQDERPKKAGDRVTNPALAQFYRMLAKKGARGFYKGQNAAAISTALAATKRNSVIMTKAEIGRYKAIERPAVCAPYRSYKICSMGPPSSGATTVLQVLGMIERFDIKAMGEDSPDAWHLIGEAMLLAYADREMYLADSDFVSVPVQGLLDKAYLTQRSALIDPAKALGKYEAGNPPGAAPRTPAKPADVPGTTHFVAVDRAGNIASYTSTIEGPFGNQMVVNGYFLNNELTDFTFAPAKDGMLVANRVEPGKRPLSSMSPTIVYGPDGQPVMTIGAAGGRTIIMQVAKALIAHLDWGMSAQDAIAAPMIYFTGTTLQVEAGTPLAKLADGIAAKGHIVMATDMSRLKANAAEKTAQGWKGAADPRSEGVALEE